MANAPILASILIGMGAMCFSFMSLFAKMAQTQGHLTCFTLLAVRSAIGLLLNFAALVPTWCRGQRTGKAATGTVLTPAHRLRRLRPGATTESKKGADSSPSDECVGRGELCGLSYSALAWLAVRAGAGFGCVLLEYAALKVLPLKVNAMIVYSSPAFIVLWAALLLRQPVRPAVLALIGVSFCGLMLEVKPWAISGDARAPLWAYAASAVAAALAGLVYVSLRGLADTSFLTVMNTFLTTCLVLSVSVGVPLGEFSLPNADLRLWAYLVGVGAFAYMAEVFVTCGYQRAGEGTGQVSVLKFLSPVLSMLWGCLLLGEELEASDLAGAALILGSSAAIVTVQARAHKAEANPKVENPEAVPEADLEADNPKIEDNPSFCLPRCGEDHPATASV
mmetsp:Transcript_75964/g.222678  ORF Transcript_75964/g.222678 Transcript_75964/m.222678 type:complete len:393 (-) Transcript_75964:55-1233(-)